MSEYGPAAPVPILQHEPEFRRLLTQYRRRKPLRTLEVGTYHGGTLYHWLQSAPAGALVVSIDSYRAGVDNRHLYQEWAPDGVTVLAIAGDSANPSIIRAAADHGPYDWLFIDAGHRYHEVKADWLNYGPLVRNGGLVAFHDIILHRDAPDNEVGRLWAELVNDGHRTREIIHDPAAEWGGIGVLTAR